VLDGSFGGSEAGKRIFWEQVTSNWRISKVSVGLDLSPYFLLPIPVYSRLLVRSQNVRILSSSSDSVLAVAKVRVCPWPQESQLQVRSTPQALSLAKNSFSNIYLSCMDSSHAWGRLSGISQSTHSSQS
jgi:hypothetical protein